MKTGFLEHRAHRQRQRPVTFGAPVWVLAVEVAGQDCGTRQAATGNPICLDASTADPKPAGAGAAAALGDAGADPIKKVVARHFLPLGTQCGIVTSRRVARSAVSQ
jgi:hypothetical protein